MSKEYSYLGTPTSKMKVDMKIYKLILMISSHMHYFGVKDMTTKKEVARHGINSNLKLIPSESTFQHISEHLRTQNVWGPKSKIGKE